MNSPSLDRIDDSKRDASEQGTHRFRFPRGLGFRSGSVLKPYFLFLLNRLDYSCHVVG